MSIEHLIRVWDEYPAGGPELLTALIFADNAGADGAFTMPPIGRLSKMIRQTEDQTRELLTAMFLSGRLREHSYDDVYGEQRYRLDWPPKVVNPFAATETP